MNNDNNWLIYVIVIVAIVILIYLYIKYVKPKPEGTIIMINGDVGSGKSSTGLYLVYSKWKTARRKTKFKNLFRKLFKKKKQELPYIYSNIPLYNVEYKEFKLEHLERKIRFDYNSKIYLNETSLIADSMLAYNMGKDDARKYINDQLKLFCKMIRHELKGKDLCMVIDTQNPNDLALGFDRVLSSSYYIEDFKNKIPFIRPVKLRKFSVNIDNVQNNYNESVDETSTKWILVNKKVFKMYNSYCYSFLTDDKPKVEEVKYQKISRYNKQEMEKPFTIVTLNNYQEIKESNEKIEKEKNENGEEK